MLNSRFETLGARRNGFLYFLLSLVFSLFFVADQCRAQEVNGVYREFFPGISGGSVANLTNSPTYPNNWTEESIVEGLFETQTSYADNYGQRLRAVLVAPETGSYTFYICSDDQSYLYLSQSEDPASMQLIAAEPSWNSARNYLTTTRRLNATSIFPAMDPNNPANRSDFAFGTINLTAGQRCYVEVLHKEGGGGDNVSVAWDRPNGAGGTVFEGPVPTTHFRAAGVTLPRPPVITEQPQDSNIIEREGTQFSVTATGLASPNFQWQVNGVDIPDGTDSTYTLNTVSLSQNGEEYRCIVYSNLGTNTSSVATLNVGMDVVNPEIVRVVNEGSNRVLVIYSEAVETSSGLLIANYSIPGVTFSGANLFNGDPRTVALDTSTTIVSGNVYNLTVNGVRDTAQTPNAILPNSQSSFTASDYTPWTIGDIAQSGIITFQPGGYDLTVASEGVFGSSDQFLLNYEVRNGDFDLSAQVESVGNSDPWARGGLMARGSLSTNSLFAAIFGTPSISGLVFSSRAIDAGAAVTSGSFPANYPYTWVRLKREGNLFTGYASYDESTWYEVGKATFTAPATMFVGMAASSRNASQSTTAEFRSIQDVTGGTIASARPRHEPPGPSTRRSGLTFSEIMYNPADRQDGLSTEFVEIFNSNQISENLSGYRLSGAIDFTFPEGTVVAAGGYLVVARNPADLMTVYGISGVHGPYANNLPNDGGRVRLRHFAGEILVEVNYESKLPWPVAADGAGPSLVLRRPSYGEGQVRAWDASTMKGGSPGRMDGVIFDGWNDVVINEWLAHTDLPQVDFVELYNRGNTAVDIGGAFISDDRSVNKYQIPASTVIQPGTSMGFNESALGFRLNAGGERVFFVSPDNTRVLDAVSFEGSENGISVGRHGDGTEGFAELMSPTFGAANSPPLSRDIVINEIMYHSITDGDDEYVELYNKGGSVVDLSGWKFVSGIDYTIPDNTTMNPGDHLVIAKDAVRLQSKYANLSSANLLGDYDGTLGNSSDTVALAKWDTTVTTNLDLSLTTNVIYITVDEVNYVDGARWGRWADGDGSSLELVDPRSDNRRSQNWLSSDETSEAGWVNIEHTGVLDHGRVGNGRSIDELQVMLLGAGEVLVDDIEVIRQGSTNLVVNGTFDSGISLWTAQGNHVNTTWNSGEGFSGPGSLFIRAAGGGDNGANRAKIKFNDFPAVGEIVTIRAKARWLSGSTNLLLRLYGNYLEASGKLDPTPTPGTPGLQNSKYASNAGPAIWEVTHNPILPIDAQPVVVTARLYDPDGLSAVQVNYRLEPNLTLSTVAMNDAGTGGDALAGDGIYSATIPGQNSGDRIAFHVEARDGLAATTYFPYDATTREALVQWGEQDPFGNYATYRFWMTSANMIEWETREKLSNQRLDMTFVYGNHRVIYNGGIRYRGSPFLRPGYSGPTNDLPALVFQTPAEEPFVGFDEFNLDWLEQPGRDPTLQREKLSFWIGAQLHVPFSHQRYVYTFINGQRLGQVYTDSQEPSTGDYISAWFDKDEGDIFKIDDWFEFNDEPRREFNENARLVDYTTSGGAKKQARYRWSWEKKSNGGFNDDYTSIFQLVDALNEPDPVLYEQSVTSLVNVEQWLRAFAVRHIVGDWDGYGYNRGKNMSTYHIPKGKFEMLLWDLDFSLGGGSHGPTQNLYSANDPTIQRLYAHPAFNRIYLQIYKEAVNGPLDPTKIEPIMDEIYDSFQESGIVAADPSPIKTWVSSRRAYIQGQTDAAEANFEITTNGGVDFSTDESLLVLEGAAPLDVRTIQINGVTYPIWWTSVNTWQIRIPLPNGQTAFAVLGYDKDGNLVPGSGDLINVTFAGQPDLMENSIVISEMMYNSGISGGDFIELENISPTTAFDLTGLRLNGLGFTFPSGTVIFPGEFLVVADNLSVFAPAFGYNIRVAGEYTGDFDKGGETISLIKPGAIPAQDIVIDSVFFDDDLPWPAMADGLGSSLQLRDSSQDNNRVGNWLAGPIIAETNVYPLVSMTNLWSYEQSGTDLGSAWKEIGYDDSTWSNGHALLYAETAPLPAPKNTPLVTGLPTHYFRTTFNNALNPEDVSLLMSLIVDDGALVYLNGQPLYNLGVPVNPVYTNYATRSITDATLEGPFELPSDLLVQGDNELAVEVHQINGTSSDVVFGLELEAREVLFGPYTPGAKNFTRMSLPEFPLVWINEIQPNNITGAVDNFGDRDPWLEIYNSGTTTVDLSGLSLSDSYTNLTKWAFPAGASIASGQFMVVWLDGEPGETVSGQHHTSFRIASATSGGVALSRDVNGQQVILDYLTFQNASNDRAFGLFPDGGQYSWSGFYFATPGEPNNNSFPAVSVVINEWMADNTKTIQNPLDQQYDDWFELFNASGSAVDLSGYYLSDSPSDPAMWEIPQGVTIPANSFLMVWADRENTTNTAHLHPNFRLNNDGDAIGLYAPDQSVVDQVTFGSQAEDLSEGRFTDGAPAPYYFLTTATPGAPNILNPPGFLPDSIVRQPDGTTDMSWASEPNRTYKVRYKDDLNDPTWTLLGQVVATGTTKAVKDTTSAGVPKRFYIIELVP